MCSWKPPIVHAVALGAPNETTLANLEILLQDKEIPHIAFREPDMGNELTAIGITPIQKSKVYEYLRKFKLIKGELK